MIAGHAGIGLAAKAIDQKLGLGTLFGAAMLLDIVGCGLELARVDHAGQIAHSLLLAVGLSVATAAGWALWRGKGGVPGALLLGLVVFSHWPLDWLVHETDMPLIWPGGTEVGFGLWREEPLAWLVEIGITVAGLITYLVFTGRSRQRRLLVVTLTVITAAITILAAYVQNPSQSAGVIASTPLAAFGLVLTLVIVIAAQWADGAAD